MILESEDADVLAFSRLSAVPKILQVITASTGLRLALVARVTDNDWKACAVHDALGFGLSAGDHLDVSTTLCKEVRLSRAPVVIEHASEDPVYASHRTPKLYNFQSYISVPLFLANGEYFGNVCALDSSPLPLKAKNAEGMMSLFGQLIAHQLDSELRVERTRAALLDERQTSELREQFIAVLGHDLRNPLSAILTSAEVLLASKLGDREHGVAKRIFSSGKRMGQLVDDVLDFARGRLGGGIAIEREPIVDLEATFRQVVDELRAGQPGRVVKLEMAGVSPFRGDRVRLAQLLSNLLANALEHGPANVPVDVRIEGTAHELTIAVTNGGAPIPAELTPRLFQPYVRSAEGNRRIGLGLGLYIVAEIVRSHGGTISVLSTASEGTTFTCRLPRMATSSVL